MMILILMLLLFSPVLAQGATRYVAASGGITSGACTTGLRCTWEYALSQTVAGDTLVLGNGTYSPKTIQCGVNAVNGTSLNQITVRAENERQAYFLGNGNADTFTLLACSYWIFEGLRLENASANNAYYGVILMIGDYNGTYPNHHITIRRFLMRHNNAIGNYCNCHAVVLYNSSYIVLEENELYDYGRHGFYLYNSSNNTLRRNYCNPRGYWPDSLYGPNSCYMQYDGAVHDNNLYENNIAEGTSDTGFWINATYSNDRNNNYYGNISLNNTNNGFAAFGNASQVVENTYYENNVAVGNTGQGFYFGGTRNTICKNCSALNTQNNGFLINNQGQGTLAQGSFNGINLLGSNLASTMNFSITETPVWRVNYINTYPATALNPPSSDTNYVHPTTINPNLQSCVVYIPNGSPMQSSGLGGDIGANVLYRYDSGILTTSPLWDFTQTGARRGEPFRSGVNQWAGAIISGVNSSNALVDVNTRLGFGTGSCPTYNYQTQPPLTATLTTRHFRCRVWNDNLTDTSAKDWYTLEDASCSVQNINGKIAIVWAIDCINAGCGTIGFDTEFQVNGGTWTDTTASVTLNALGYDNTQVGGAVHGATIPGSLLTNPQSTFVPGKVLAQDLNWPQITFALNTATNYLASFAIKDGLTIGSTQICVRPKQDNGTAISHDVTACFNVVNPGAQTP